jgi:hypothetical protein
MMKVCSRCFDVVQTFNKMLASFRVEMELGIGGSKKKMEMPHEEI